MRGGGCEDLQGAPLPVISDFGGRREGIGEGRDRDFGRGGGGGAGRGVGAKHMSHSCARMAARRRGRIQKPSRERGVPRRGAAAATQRPTGYRPREEGTKQILLE